MRNFEKAIRAIDHTPAWVVTTALVLGCIIAVAVAADGAKDAIP